MAKTFPSLVMAYALGLRSTYAASSRRSLSRSAAGLAAVVTRRSRSATIGRALAALAACMKVAVGVDGRIELEAVGVDGVIFVQGDGLCGDCGCLVGGPYEA